MSSPNICSIYLEACIRWISWSLLVILTRVCLLETKKYNIGNSFPVPTDYNKYTGLSFSMTDCFWQLNNSLKKQNGRIRFPVFILIDPFSHSAIFTGGVDGWKIFRQSESHPWSLITVLAVLAFFCPSLPLHYREGHPFCTAASGPQWPTSAGVRGIYVVVNATNSPGSGQTLRICRGTLTRSTGRHTFIQVT